MMMDKNSRVEKIIFLFLLILSILSMALLFYPTILIGFTTTDDSNFALVGQGSNQDKFFYLLSLAKDQGRIGVLIGGCFIFIPYLVDSLFYYSFMKIGSCILVLTLLYICIITVYRSNFIGLLFIIIFAGCVQNSWDHNLLTSYPLYFNLLFSFFILSILSFLKYVTTNMRIYALMSGVFYFISLSNELFVIYLSLFFIIWLFIFYLNVREEVNFKPKLKHLYPIFISLIFYVSLYLVWRYLYPSNYDGNQLNASFITSLKVIWQYSISAVPGFYFFSGNGNPQYSFSNLFLDIHISWIIKSLMVGIVISFSLCSIKYKQIKTSYLLVGLLTSLVCVFIPNLLLGLTRKYQQWVSHGSLSYAFTYFSFIAITCFFTIGLSWLTSLVRNKLAKIILSISAGLFFLFISIITDFHNHFINTDQVLSQSKWRTFDLFLKTSEFRSIPDGSIIYSPSLFEHRGIVENDLNYWSNYVRQKAKKSIEIMKDLPLNKLGQNKAIYFLKYDQEPLADNQYLLFARIHNMYSLVDPSLLKEFSATIFSYSQNRWINLTGFLSSFPMMSNANVFINDIRVTQRKGLVFNGLLYLDKGYGDLPTIKIRSDAKMEIDNFIISYYKFLPNLSQRKIVLGDGFYGWESSNENGNKWSWASGDGRLIILNSDEGITPIRMYFFLNTLLPRSVTIYSDGLIVSSYKLNANQEQEIQVDLELQPGRTVLDFKTDKPPKLPGNGDPRELSFSLGNIRLEDKQ